MRYFALILIVCLVYAEEAQLPAEAAKVVAEHDQIVTKAKAAYEATVAKADADAAKKLEPLLVKVTKAGDLNGANAIKDKVDSYKENQNDLLGEAAFPVGKWGVVGVPSQYYILNADKTWVSAYKNYGGSWSVRKGEIILVSTAGYNNTSTVPMQKEADWGINGGAVVVHVRWEPMPKATK